MFVCEYIPVSECVLRSQIHHITMVVELQAFVSALTNLYERSDPHPSIRIVYALES